MHRTLSTTSMVYRYVREHAKKTLASEEIHGFIKEVVCYATSLNYWNNTRIMVGILFRL